MANIFEELMLQNGRLTESIKPTKESRCRCRRIHPKNLKIESIRIFEDADFDKLDELDDQFAVDVDEAEENNDEVVLVIDPEIPAEDEVPEDAAENLVGDYVYKCPVCGANYVCACDAVETESIEVDEEGVPTECPICGDDAEQILVGEIAPVGDVEGKEDEQEMEPVEVEEEDEEEEVEEDPEEEEEVEEESEDFEEGEEVEEDEEEEYQEESLRRRRVQEAKQDLVAKDASELQDGDYVFRDSKGKKFLGTFEKSTKAKDKGLAKQGFLDLYFTNKEDPVEEIKGDQTFYVASGRYAKGGLKKKFWKDADDNTGKSKRDSEDEYNREKRKQQEIDDENEKDHQRNRERNEKRLAASYRRPRRESVEVEVKVDDDDDVKVETSFGDDEAEDTFEIEEALLEKKEKPEKKSVEDIQDGDYLFRDPKGKKLIGTVDEIKPHHDRNMAKQGYVEIWLNQKDEPLVDTKDGAYYVKPYWSSDLTRKAKKSGADDTSAKDERDSKKKWDAEKKEKERKQQEMDDLNQKVRDQKKKELAASYHGSPRRRMRESLSPELKAQIERAVRETSYDYDIPEDEYDPYDADSYVDTLAQYITHDVLGAAGQHDPYVYDAAIAYAKQKLWEVSDEYAGLAESIRKVKSRRRVKEGLTFDSKTFNKLMTQIVRENYKNSPTFKAVSATLKEGKLNIKYTVTEGKKVHKGTLVAEGFKKNASKFSLRMRDKGVFTEKLTKTPAFRVECKTVRGRVLPLEVNYDFSKRLGESLYRVYGTSK